YYLLTSKTLSQLDPAATNAGYPAFTGAEIEVRIIPGEPPITPSEVAPILREVILLHFRKMKKKIQRQKTEAFPKIFNNFHHGRAIPLFHPRRVQQTTKTKRRSQD